MPAIAENLNRKVIIVLGQGEEDNDEFYEVLRVMQVLHECMHEAKHLGKTVRIEMSIANIE